VDRWDRKRILVICNLLLAPLYALLLFFDTPSMIWVVYLVGFIGNLIRQLLNPAEMALLPRLVGEGDLVSANSLNSLNSNLARLVGPALGGVAFATLGFHASVLIDVATFVLAGLMIAAISAPSSITRPEPQPHAHDEAMSAGKKMRADWLAGIKVIRNSRILMGLFALIGVLNIVDGIVTVLLAVYVKHDLGGGAPELGWLMTAQAVGGLLGSIFVARFIRKLPAWLNIGIGFILFGVLDFFIFGFPVLISNMLLLVAVGIPLMALEVSAITLFQTATEDRYRGRIFGIYGTISGVLLLLGRGIATLIGGQVDVSMLLAVVSLIYIPTGLLAFRLLREPRGSNVVSPARVEEAIPVSAQPTAGA
jgi:MFS family permease